MVSQITSNCTVCSTIFLAYFKVNIKSLCYWLLWLVDSPHKGPVIQKTFPCDDVIMQWKKLSVSRMSFIWHFSHSRVSMVVAHWTLVKLVQVMAWCHQAPCHSLNQRSPTPSHWSLQTHKCIVNWLILGIGIPIIKIRWHHNILSLYW